MPGTAVRCGVTQLPGNDPQGLSRAQISPPVTFPAFTPPVPCPWDMQGRTRQGPSQVILGVQPREQLPTAHPCSAQTPGGTPPPPFQWEVKGCGGTYWGGWFCICPWRRVQGSPAPPDSQSWVGFSAGAEHNDEENPIAAACVPSWGQSGSHRDTGLTQGPYSVPAAETSPVLTPDVGDTFQRAWLGRSAQGHRQDLCAPGSGQAGNTQGPPQLCLPTSPSLAPLGSEPPLVLSPLPAPSLQPLPPVREERGGEHRTANSSWSCVRLWVCCWSSSVRSTWLDVLRNCSVMSRGVQTGWMGSTLPSRLMSSISDMLEPLLYGKGVPG